MEIASQIVAAYPSIGESVNLASEVYGYIAEVGIQNIHPKERKQFILHFNEAHKTASKDLIALRLALKRKEKGR